jgi:hypothetical protein
MESAHAFSQQAGNPDPINDHITRARVILAKSKDMLPSEKDAQEAAKEIDKATGIQEGSALATVAGESVTERQKRIEEVKVQAVDLSSLVRKKKPAATHSAAAGAIESNGNGKRKLEEAEQADSKKVRVK